LAKEKTAPAPGASQPSWPPSGERVHDPDFSEERLHLMEVQPTPGSHACGDVRVSVKTMTDALAKGVSMKSSASSVAKLVALKAPVFTESAPRHPAEKKTYQISALLLGFGQENDQDFHLVLGDTTDPKVTMVAEIPSPDCTSTAPDAAKGRIAAARKAFGDQFKVTGEIKKLQVPVPVTLTGVLFFDKVHGQAGVAKNGVELHPVLDICFGAACAQTKSAVQPKPQKKVKAPPAGKG
jgi:hypothetical protein